MAKDISSDLIKRGGLIQNRNQLQLFKNIQFSMYPSRAFSILLQKISKEKGENYILNLGKVMGKASGEKMKKEIKKIKQLLKSDYQSIPHMIEVTGFGKISQYIEQKDEIRLEAKNHPVITHAKNLYKNKEVSSKFYGEVYKEYIEIFSKEKIKKIVIEKDKEICRWIFKKC